VVKIFLLGLPPSFDPVLQEVDRMQGILDLELVVNKSISPLPSARTVSSSLLFTLMKESKFWRIVNKLK